MCCVLEMEREKAMEEERMQNELRQRKKMEKERKREELARQKEKEELRKREEEEEGVCMCTTVLNTSYTKSHVLQQKGGEGKGGGRGRACICSLMRMMA